MHKNTEEWLNAIGGNTAKEKLEAAMSTLHNKAQSDGIIYKEENDMDVNEKDTELTEEVVAEVETETQAEVETTEETPEPVEEVETKEVNVDVVTLVNNITKMVGDNFNEVAEKMLEMQETINTLKSELESLRESKTKAETSFVDLPIVSFSSIMAQKSNAQSEDMAEELLKEAPEENTNVVEEDSGVIPFLAF